MPAPARVLCAGLATYDVIQLVERLPLPDEKVAALAFVTAAGGPAANAAVACAHLGSAPTLVTALPHHPLSSLITDDLSAHGVDVAAVASYAGAPITATIMVTEITGERAVVSPTAAATDVELALVEGVLPKTHYMSCVLVDGYFRSLSLPIAREARERGIPVILDAGSFKPYTDELLLNVDVAVVSDAFRPPRTDGSPDAIFAYLRARGVMWAAITRGSGSIVYLCPGGSGEVAVPLVEGVVDTLGAGDFFHGALAHRIATLGLGADRFADDLAFAAGVVARSLTSFGTRAWLEG
jgi:sugar/nucleoside kinase (ribokinase family)